jgi:hypothetical protein
MIYIINSWVFKAESKSTWKFLKLHNIKYPIDCLVEPIRIIIDVYHFFANKYLYIYTVYTDEIELSAHQIELCLNEFLKEIWGKI